MSYKFIFFISLIVCFGFTSCVKEYTCRCTMTYTGSPGFDKKEFDFKLRDSEKGAHDKCEAQSTTYEYNGIKTVEDCKIW